ncbi:bifunctional serine/threonine-protein kinase/formylglycine-generating enzyme family protein [Luteimonas composti]|uniref:Bifunctional serine/threonine-protein kinase/formylglycine-generating enzyme family protein n=1 Tax=Luteimonas composti TaxID=398257 RepID=A0ABT6MRQ1_9GAMM|nr:bifunctional serine/threonine-protein kinase/formylglycine-generating enzyme family protein [Luteimonas composti]MDH7453287.1 bifunctional serine/threonine-protein kinase/formylglycine-generating enzyme family protein [Luteimonas composti]
MGKGASASTQVPMPDIAGYRLTRVIGEGGMSTVYLGTQVSLGREVAIKLMRPEALADEVSRRRFENEARTIARLEHPHIVGIHEVGRSADGLPWYAMPYLPRGHVGQRDLTGDPERVREILRALLSALGYAHARGVVHRDVKAENVLFDEADRPLLADFGIALRRGHGTRVTMTGLAVGSTAYMAPEQARGEQVDHRADLYSVGVLAWEMLAGELPYKADDALAMAIQHAQKPVPKLPPGLRHWQRFMERALAKSPARRFHDAAQMLSALEQVPASAHAGTWPGLPVVQRLRAVPGMAWIGLALVVAAALGLALQRTGPVMPATGSPPALAAGVAPPAVHPPAPTDGDAMHGAAPLSPADLAIDRMHERIAAGRLAWPAEDSATAHLLAAARADPKHPQLGESAAVLTDALGAAAADAIARDRDDDSGLLLRAAARVREGAGAVPADALRRWQDGVGKALSTRMEAAAGKLDRARAQRVVEFAGLAGLPAPARQRLQAQAARVPDLGGRTADDLDGMVLLEGPGKPVAAFPRPVSRAEYARFAEVNGREPALCRERISLLRVLDPRNWQTPGFEQGDGDPVVCVSWRDADAYAQWRGRRDGHRYRLATAAEAARLPAAPGERAVSEWRADCGDSCARRAATGPSWRTDSRSRSLVAERGYDDVGFRLVRDL